MNDTTITTTVCVDLRYEDADSAISAIEKSSTTSLINATDDHIKSVTVPDYRWWGQCKKNLHNEIVSCMFFHYILPPPGTKGKTTVVHRG